MDALLYMKNFVLDPSFQERQPWVIWLTGKFSVIPAHYWTASRFLGGAATIGLTDKPVLSLIVFLLFALTDWVDGKVARFRNEQGNAGALLDGIADKVFILPIIAYWGIQFSHMVFVALLFVIEIAGYLLVPIFSVKREKEGIFEHIMAGKYKFALQVVLVSVLWIAQNLAGVSFLWIIAINAIWGGVIILAILSVAGKINPKWAI